ncbi:MAG: AAA family ATPase [Candidatus Cryptobacteroides sp.]
MRYPIGIQTFDKIRTDNYVYVDKTAMIYELAHGSGQYYFLSRPRRFGKSLLISTMDAYFSGRKELFDGLAIAELEKEWAEYPVLRIDFSAKSYTSHLDLEQQFDKKLSALEQQYGVENKYTLPDVRFQNLIEGVYKKTGKQVVILIDEYEKPIVDNLDNPELMETFRRIMQGFYSVIKGYDQYIRFGFLTGVTKLGKLSVFSGLNNLQDISMDARYVGICGITEGELKSYFGESVAELARANNLSTEECYRKLAKKYDGYHFIEDSEGIYNPFSLINVFNTGRFRDYWYATGTPDFLVRYLKAGKFKLNNLSNMKASPSLLTGSNYSSPDPVTLMYQAGYLTIVGYDERFGKYVLDYPNDEVRSGFLESLSHVFAPKLANGEFSADSFVEDICAGDIEGFMTRFTAFLADNSYLVQGDLELYFQNTMSIMLKMMGFYVRTEYYTSNGRIDIVFETDKYVYIIELKRDCDPEAALGQIEEKGYDKPFLASGKEIFKLGINFSSETRTVDGWKMSR